MENSLDESSQPGLMAMMVMELRQLRSETTGKWPINL